MASLDSLPGDQRAVLQLVLGRGRSYDEIARLLSINPDAVRERALAALDALGPPTPVPAADRMRICDYLLGQLPEADVPAVRDLLDHSAGERAWARVLSSELAPVASGPLPEIPLDTGAAPPAAPAPQDAPAPQPAPPPQPAAPAPPARDAADGPTPRRRRLRGTSRTSRTPRPPREPAPLDTGAGSGDGPRSSRRGGAVVIGLGAIILIVVLVLVFKNGSGSKSSSPSAATTSSNPAVASTTTTTGSATTTSASSATAKAVAQINLTPTTAGSKAAGIAEVLDQSSVKELAIVAEHVPPNTTNPNNAYAVWLYNSPSDAYRLGFVNPGVTSTGKLSTAGKLPANAARYRELIVTTETQAHPRSPGPILLQGPVSGVS